MDAKYFRQCVEFVAGVVDANEARPSLRGVLLEFSPGRINMVGTDGKRMAIVRTDAAHMMGDGSVIVRPPQGLETLAGPVTFLDGMVMDDGGRFVTLEPIAAPIIDWRRAIQHQAPMEYAAFDPELLADTLERLAPFGPVTVSTWRVTGGPSVHLTAKKDAQAVVMGVKE